MAQGGEVEVRSGRSIQNGTGRGGGSEEWEEHARQPYIFRDRECRSTNEACLGKAG